MIETKAIVISKQDSGDKDVIITLFSLEKGVLKAKLKGVKNQNAKMKFAKELFCFGNFMLTESSGGYSVVTNCDCLDTFYEISTDYDAFFEASQIIRIVGKIVQVNQSNPSLFVEVLKALKALAYEKPQKNYVLCKFLIALFFNEGYYFHSERCSNCNNVLVEDRFLCLNTGEILCSFCKDDSCISISYAVNKCIKFLSETDYDRLSTISFAPSNINKTLDILLRNYEFRFLS